jgi:hypothetical protein
MIKVLCFSKDRPLQLQAYLDSLLVLGGINIWRDKVTVLVADKTPYQHMFGKQYPDCVEWIDEQGNFDYAMRQYAETLKDTDTVLFGCDDVVWIRPTNLQAIPAFLEVAKDIIGFSFRLGKNISQKPTQVNKDKVFYQWSWLNQPSHWGYPFELMASVYRGSMIKEIVNANKTQMQCPNHLESFGVTYCINNKREQHPYMTMFNTPNYAVAQDVNRVQHHFQNKYDGTEEHSVENLKTLFEQGKEIDWSNLFGIVPSEPFCGKNYWKIKE